MQSDDASSTRKMLVDKYYRAAYSYDMSQYLSNVASWFKVKHHKQIVNGLPYYEDCKYAKRK